MASYKIHVQQKEKVLQSIAVALRTAVTVTLRHEKIKPPAEVTLLLTDDDQLKSLNKAYRGIDAPTDVLSFEPGDSMPGMEEDEAYLGDIVIAVPTAERQAKEGGHSLKAELQLLTVHGTLHLLGFDHEEPEEKDRMWWTQASILAQLGAEITGPPEDAEG
ncbi:MAG: rRNA maturation RNase YbeY [Ardenticatenaceae bacterium]|nr:rRNA maturation RNase YbeY [Anaerolineales bacterium]MCB8941521.1 rRNA maturation RNase YbeY [Ardenticatenaceae bacterium]MCB8974585.1 rRNA maturation RNase YbeY [Ardenticatenaceae bacterium]